MILGNNKAAVIENIKSAIEREDYNCKVEVNDPKLCRQEKEELIKKYLKIRNRPWFRFCNFLAMFVVNVQTIYQNRKTRIEGLDHFPKIKTGAIITSNHFNPIDNTIVRKAIRRKSIRKIHIVSQDTNLAMKGFIGFLMNHADIIPISNNASYMEQEFRMQLQEVLKKRRYILIYPEEEMWFNYRKPRPLKRGAYYYAAKFRVPIISCFVEMIDCPQLDTEEFYKVRYVMHILDTIYPNPELSVRENSIRMKQKDYEQKKEAYEKAYGKKLSYAYEEGDIAGWIPKMDDRT